MKYIYIYIYNLKKKTEKDKNINSKKLFKLFNINYSYKDVFISNLNVQLV